MRICVLLSTYNGEDFIEQQLNSIINQDAETFLYIRDDGSSDNTVHLLKKFEKQYPEKIKIVLGENIGPAQSFYRLMRECPDEYEFYAFADQDDIWKEGKLKAAIAKLEKISAHQPALYYCASNAYFSEDNIGEKSVCSEARARSYKAVLNTFATSQGCTMVFNHKLLQEICLMKFGTIDMHDSFVHAACLCLGGTVVCDSKSYVLYRMHLGQVTGSESVKLNRRIENFQKKRKTRKSTCKVLLSSEHLKTECMRYLMLLSNYDCQIVSRLKLILSPKPEGMNNKEMMLFRIKILTGRY